MSAEWHTCALDGAPARAPCRCFGPGQLRDPAAPYADGEAARMLRPLQAAAVTYRIDFGSRAGQKVLTLRGARPREVTACQALCAEVDGFSLHAAVRIEAHERKRLERLCRLSARSGPAFTRRRDAADRSFKGARHNLAHGLQRPAA